MYSDERGIRFGGFISIKAREREREREREKKTKRRRGDIIKLSLSLWWLLLLVVVVLKFFFFDTNTHGFLSPKEEKTQILLLVGASWKSFADETVRGGEIRETSIRSRARDE